MTAIIFGAVAEPFEFTDIQGDKHRLAMIDAELQWLQPDGMGGWIQSKIGRFDRCEFQKSTGRIACSIAEATGSGSSIAATLDADDIDKFMRVLVDVFAAGDCIKIEGGRHAGKRGTVMSHTMSLNFVCAKFEDGKEHGVCACFVRKEEREESETPGQWERLASDQVCYHSTYSGDFPPKVQLYTNDASCGESPDIAMVQIVNFVFKMVLLQMPFGAKEQELKMKRLKSKGKLQGKPKRLMKHELPMKIKLRGPPASVGGIHRMGMGELKRLLGAVSEIFPMPGPPA